LQSDSAVLKKDWKNITTSKAEDADENGPFTTGLAVNDSSTGASIVVFGTPYVVDDSTIMISPVITACSVFIVILLKV